MSTAIPVHARQGSGRAFLPRVASAENLKHLAYALGLGLFLVWPAIALLVGALYDAMPGSEPEWGLEAFRRVWGHPSFWTDFGTTVLITAIVVPSGVVIGLFLALYSGLVERRARFLLDPIILIAFTLPPLFYALSYAILGGGRGGLLNSLASTWLGVRPGIDFTSWAGLLFVSVLRASAGTYIYISPAVRNLTRSGDEAAQISGASLWTRIVHIILPQLRPALFGVSIILVIAHLTLFDAVLILGGPDRIDSLAILSYKLLGDRNIPDYPAASVVALSIMACALGLVVLQRRLVHVDRSATVSGKPEPALVIRPGGLLRGTALALVAGWLFFLFVLPLFSIALTSFSPFPGVYTRFTLAQYSAALAEGEALRSFTLTLGVAGGSAVLGVAVSLAILDLQYARPGRWIGRFVNIASMMPIAMSGVVGAIGYLWAILLVPGGANLFGTPLLLVIVLSAGTIPTSMLLLRGSYLQFDRSMVDAAKICGNSGFGAFVRIRLPLLLPTVATVLYLAFIAASGALDAALILGSAAMKPLPALIFESYSNMHFAKACVLLILMLVGYGLVRLLIQAVVWAFRKDLRPAFPRAVSAFTARPAPALP